MPCAAPSTRGILRRSSYQSSISSSNHDGSLASELGDLSLAEGEVMWYRTSTSRNSSSDNSSVSSSLSSSPMKPQRRNVGKVQHQRQRCPAKKRTREAPERSISFSEEVEERPVPRMSSSCSAKFFYDEDEIAQFRHEKFMEDAGLDPVTYEPLPL
ncbi:MAG: hypothetical protein SGARI_004728, partial [Bacillariaceae sp.]